MKNTKIMPILVINFVIIVAIYSCLQFLYTTKLAKSGIGSGWGYLKYAFLLSLLQIIINFVLAFFFMLKNSLSSKNNSEFVMAFCLSMGFVLLISFPLCWSSLYFRENLEDRKHPSQGVNQSLQLPLEGY
jgi:hypothetical protein